MIISVLSIRPIQFSDNISLAQIIKSSIEELHLPTEGTAHSDPTTNDLLTLFQTPGSFYWVAEQEGSVLGGCGIYPSNGLPAGYCELVRFFLTPVARGKGIGLALMQKSFQTAIEMGYTHCYLESFPEMKQAVAMYERNGFTRLNAPLGNTGHFSCNVWMVKKLQ
ncbi:MAG: GNAT family N-acetyltransferase [Bacteroidia bacterium]|nr:GNAT family N-acetyltransferase [Bacteroidia bacterium]